MRMTGPRWTAFGYAIAYALAQVAFAARMHFHLAVNDFLGLVSVGQNIDWSEPETLHNGFFPFGLPAIISLMPTGAVLPAMALLSVTFGTVALLATFEIANRLTGPWWGLVAVVLLSVSPQFFSYFASPGPDMIAVGLAMLAFALYVRESDRNGTDARMRIVFMSGLVFGVAGLFRYHAALLCIGLVAWALLRQTERARYALIAISGVLVGFAPQILINVAGGLGPFASDSAFTIYQSVVPIDWHATSEIDAHAYASVLGVAAANPFEFAVSYFTSLGKFGVPIAIIAIAVLLQRSRRNSTVMVSLLLAAVGYAAVVSTGNSPRGLIPLLPLAAVAVAVIAQWASDATADRAPSWQRATAISLAIGFLVGLPSLTEDAAVAQGRRNVEHARRAVDDAVATSGIVTDARQILTNDFDLYFEGIDGITPDVIGGWTNISRNGSSPHTDVDVTSLTAFYCDARSRGIRMVLWSPGSVPGLSPDLEEVFNGAWKSPLLKNAGAVGNYTMTFVQNSDYACG